MSTDSEPVSGPGLLVGLDPPARAGVSLHEQLEQRLREHVRSGRIPSGARLPSSRALAKELGISRGVVLEAYAQLTAEGYLTASQGAPTRVAATAPTAERAPIPASTLQRRSAYQFDPSLPDLLSFPRQRWLHATRAALRDVSFDELGPGDPRGAPRLRNELMRYLSRVRAAAPEPEHTLICTGFTQGFALLCRALRDRGLEQIAVEDPGWPQHRVTAEHAGLEAVAIPVDEHGLIVDALSDSGCEAVVVTPAHQFPTGVVLAAERRTALLEWAEERDGLIVEDDYDSELRYDRDPVGALQGLAPERVCNIGSMGKRLAPGLALGWVLSPSWLTGALTYEKGTGDGASPVLDQLALGEFIASGELDRHLRRMRLRYRARREQLLRSLDEALPGVEVAGVGGGVHLLALLPDGIDESALLRAAAARGVGAEGLSWHRLQTHGPGGLVFGFANLPEAAIERGVGLIADALNALTAI